MTITKQFEDDMTTLYLEGRLDANTAPQLNDFLLGVDESKDLVFDIKDLEYVSSAGLRVFLTMQKKMNTTDKTMVIRNVSRDIMDIFEVTGFSDILKIEKKLREVSTDGCTLIGSGCCGECWKLDDETILKLYFEGTDRQIIEWEKNYAKEAFKLGIPTAISYDMVTSNNRMGVVFEMLKAETLSSVMVKNMDDLEHYAGEFAKLAKIVHETKAPKGAFPNATDQLLLLLEKNTWMTPQEHERYLQVLDSLPKKETCIHGDFHTSNVMIQNGELMFIDMGDFSVGNPLFDIAHVYNLYELNRTEALSKAVTKLEKEQRKLFWRYFVKEYFGIHTEKELEELHHDLQPYVSLRQVKYIPFFAETAETNKKILREGL